MPEKPRRRKDQRKSKTEEKQLFYLQEDSETQEAKKWLHEETQQDASQKWGHQNNICSSNFIPKRKPKSQLERALNSNERPANKSSNMHDLINKNQNKKKTLKLAELKIRREKTQANTIEKEYYKTKLFTIKKIYHPNEERQHCIKTPLINPLFMYNRTLNKRHQAVKTKFEQIGTNSDEISQHLNSKVKKIRRLLNMEQTAQYNYLQQAPLKIRGIEQFF